MASLIYVVDRDVICSRSHSKRYVFRFFVENHFCHQRYSLCLLYSYEVRSRRGTGNKATNEKQKLRYKYKREFKVQLLIHSLCQHISKKNVKFQFQPFPLHWALLVTRNGWWLGYYLRLIPATILWNINSSRYRNSDKLRWLWSAHYSIKLSFALLMCAV